MTATEDLRHRLTDVLWHQSEIDEATEVALAWHRERVAPLHEAARELLSNRCIHDGRAVVLWSDLERLSTALAGVLADEAPVSAPAPKKETP